MQNRRTFLGLAAAAFVPLDVDAQPPTVTQTSPARQAPELARHALNGALEGFEVVLLELNNPPSQLGLGPGSGPGHRHPGPVLAYVLEGQMRFAINNQPVRAIPAGSTFFEPTGALHTGGGSASADARARALVFMVVPKGSAVVTPA
jgi:cupin domain